MATVAPQDAPDQTMPGSVPDSDQSALTVGADDPDAYTNLGHDALDQWRAERADKTLHVTEVASNPTEQALADIRDGLMQSQLGKGLLEDLADTDTALGHETTHAIGDRMYAAYLINLDTAILKEQR